MQPVPIPRGVNEPVTLWLWRADEFVPFFRDCLRHVARVALPGTFYLLARAAAFVPTGSFLMPSTGMASFQDLECPFPIHVPDLLAMRMRDYLASLQGTQLHEVLVEPSKFPWTPMA